MCVRIPVIEAKVSLSRIAYSLRSFLTTLLLIDVSSMGIGAVIAHAFQMCRQTVRLSITSTFKVQELLIDSAHPG